jgi:hypothetical protein
VACDPEAEINDENLIDSFVPKFLKESKRNQPLCDSASDLSDPPGDDDFEVEQFVSDSAVSLVAPPFAGWSFGGATGIVGNYYLDWTVDELERISLVAGEIDSGLEAGREATLTIDPLTQEYRLGSSDVQTPMDDDLTFFYLYNERTESLSPIQSGDDWCSLGANEVIVATTNGALMELDIVNCSNCQQLAEVGVQTGDTRDPWNSEAKLMEHQNPRFSPNAELSKAADLATFFRQTTGNSQPLLVLKRD